MFLAPGVSGFWGDTRAEKSAGPTWQAQWIWISHEKESNTMLARRAFRLRSAPESARLRITASSQYQLTVNGTYVSRGPARCAPHHQSYDEFEIAGLLRKGMNSLAVRVHYQEGTVSYHHSGRAGLLAQLDLTLDGGIQTVSTDSSWRVHADPSWDEDSPRISRFHLEVCDRVDLREQVRGWTGIAFDDSSWSFAKSLLRDVGWPEPAADSLPQALTPPWTSLIRRDIPYLQEREVRAAKFIEAVPITGNRFSQEETAGVGTPIIRAVALSKQIDPRIEARLRSFQQAQGSLEIPPAGPYSGWFLLVDFGTVLNGVPRLDIEGTAGAVIDIMCAPFILDNQFSANIVDSQLIDRIVLSGCRDQWEATYFKPTRYLGIVVRGGAEAVRLHGVGVRQIEYPFEMKGRLQTPANPWFEEFSKAAAKTIRVCTTDAYTDNYRERRQYAQTAYYASLGNYWTFGDTALQRRYLKQMAEEQEGNGMMPAYAPRFGDDFMVILDSNCFWIRGLRNYLLYSGDFETVWELLPAARKLMELLDGYTNSLGLLDNPPYAYWLDHARNDRRGANFCLNGHYLGALEDFAEVLSWLGETDAHQFHAQAKRLRQSLHDHFWNPSRELFCDALVDGEQSQMFSEHANAMALAMKVATDEQAEAIAAQLLADDEHDYIQRASGITMVTPAMSYFLHAGLCRYGYVKESLGMLRARFSGMLHMDTNQTLWEEWWLDGTGRTGKLSKGRTRSDAQTESAFAPALFAEFILGVRPLKPGLREIALSLPEAGLSQVEGVIPSPIGSLTVQWKLAEPEGCALYVDVPAGMQVKLDLNSLKARNGRDILVDGEPLEASVDSKPSSLLKQGEYIVRF